MSLKKQVEKVIEITFKDLLDGRYKLIEEGRFDNKIEYKGSVLEIWIANGADCCKISSSGTGLNFPEFNNEMKKVVYKTATTKTDYLFKKKLTSAKKEQSDCYKQYKDSIEKVKKIKASLEAFKNEQDK